MNSTEFKTLVEDDGRLRRIEEAVDAIATEAGYRIARLAVAGFFATAPALAPLHAQALTSDWAALAHYRDANVALGDPKPGEQRVVFYGNSITAGWTQYFGTMFPGKPGPSTLEMIEDNLVSMAELAKASGIRVVLSSVLPVYDYPWKPGLEPAPKIVALNAWIREYADTHDAVYLDYHTAMAGERMGLQGGLSGDGVHPNEAGYQVMAPLAEKAIAEALRRR